MIAEILIVLGCVIYGLWMSSLRKAWKKAESFPNVSEFTGSVAVLVAFRNEEGHLDQLLGRLHQQSYSSPLHFYLINDLSEDHSLRIAEEWCAKDDRFKVYSSPGVGKKEALDFGMSKIEAEVVLCTDADVEITHEWVASMSGYFSNPEVEMVVGPVVFNRGSSVFSACVSWEFASLVGTTRSFIHKNRAIMANGANLGYRRDSYYRTFHLNRQGASPSGDDLFLLRRIMESNAKGVITPNWNVDTIVKTDGPAQFSDFWQQRIRWASKTGGKTGFYSVSTALAVFTANFALVLLCLLNPVYALIGFLFKALVDYWFLYPVTKALDIPQSVPIHLLTEVLNLLYIPAVAFYSPFGSYRWKNRQASSEGFKK